MPTTYEPIATNTLSAITTSVTFSSIPATYTDLVLVVDYIASGGAVYSNVVVNNLSTGIYARTEMLSSGGGAFSQKLNNETNLYTSIFATVANSALQLFNFSNYANTNVFKTALFRGGSVQSNVSASSHIIRTTAAINQLKVETAGNSYAVGSIFTLYGIKAA